MNKYVIPDIHGMCDKLVKVINQLPLEERDRLIFLGDYVDRGLKSFELISYLIELSKTYDCIFLKGNHDAEFIHGLNTGHYGLFPQGARETLKSYIDNCFPDAILDLESNFSFEHIPAEHKQFYNNLKLYYIDEENNLYVHGGINRHKTILEQEETVLLWDRDFLASVRSYSIMKNNEYPFKIKDNFKEVFLGHTPVQYLGNYNTPQKYANVWAMDVDVGKGGELVIMNVETKKRYIS